MTLLQSLAAVAIVCLPLRMWAAPVENAVLVRQAILHVSPDTTSPKLAEVGRGREVTILAKSRDWLQVFADVDPERRITGWILDKGVVRTSMPNGDRILFGEAVDSETEASRRGGRRAADRDALRLYRSVAEHFPQSPLAGEALYRAADIRWQLEAEDVRTRPSAKERDPLLRGKIEEEWMREVEKKFPGSKWADLAAFHLIDNKLCGDWEGLPKCPEKESGIYEKYASEHAQSPAAPEALYQAAWRQAALIQIYKGANQAGRAEGAKNKATSLAQRIVGQYPQSDWAARAQRLIYMMEQNIPTYGNVTE